MPKQIYDVIVIGTGAGAEWRSRRSAKQTEVCAINAGRRLDPEKDFRYHRMPWDMKFAASTILNGRSESFGYMDNRVHQSGVGP